MKSFAHQSLSAKRIKKLAAQISDDEVRDSLGDTDNNRPFIWEVRSGAIVGFWNSTSGPSLMMDDDSVRSYAQVEYLRRNGYPTFKSDEEMHAYARANGWPVPKSEQRG